MTTIADGPIRLSHRHPELPCPLDSGWRHWTMFHNRYDAVPQEVKERMALARGANWGRLVLDVRPRWTIAADDVTRRPVTPNEFKEPWRFRAGSPWHLHTELVLGSDVVHIDACGACRTGPGSFWEETRIHVGGELLGRSGHCGCSLGGGSLREDGAVALVGRYLVEVHLEDQQREKAAAGTVRVCVYEEA